MVLWCRGILCRGFAGMYRVATCMYRGFAGMYRVAIHVGRGFAGICCIGYVCM